MFHHPSAMMLVAKLEQMEARLTDGIQQLIQMETRMGTGSQTPNNSVSLPSPPELVRQQATCQDTGMEEEEGLPPYEEEECKEDVNGDFETKEQLDEPRAKRFRADHSSASRSN